MAQFENSKMSNLEVLSPIKAESGAKSLWKTIQYIIQKRINRNGDFFILWEDDHQFSPYYRLELLEKCIEDAQLLDADILSGGVSWFKTGVQVSKNLFWVEKFSGLQFTIIFKKFYDKILEATDFSDHDAADYKISDLSDKKFVIYPFLSVQKEFGYSDVTSKNNVTGRVDELFKGTSEQFELLKKVRQFYFPDIKILAGDEF